MYDIIGYKIFLRVRSVEEGLCRDKDTRETVVLRRTLMIKVKELRISEINPKGKVVR